jgi:hypothetical protein
MSKMSRGLLDSMDTFTVGEDRGRAARAAAGSRG